MSPVSQTSARPSKGPGFPVRFAVSMAAAAAIVGFSMSGAWRAVARMALSAQPHAPDLGLFDRLPLAIKIHLLAAVAALILGAVLMSVRKGRVFHRVAGWAWVSLVSVVAGASIFITSLNHGRWSILHLFTGWTLLVLPLAVIWAKRHDVSRHRRMMMGLFYGGFAANLLVAFIPGRTLWMMFMG